MCLGVKHILTSGGECKRLSPMVPSAFPTMVVKFMCEFQIFRALVERADKYQFGPSRYH